MRDSYKRVRGDTQSGRMGKVKIGVVAPASKVPPDVAEKVTALAMSEFPDAQVIFHPQTQLIDNHFAGDDAARTAAFLDIANDASFDALWVARGGYGCSRIAPAALAGLKPAAKNKQYLGYSDTGFLLAGLYKHGYRAVHGPVAHDIRRDGGEAATRRALSFFTTQANDTLEPAVLKGTPVAAFNMIILSNLIGTELMPDLSGHILMLEEVSEHYYAIDRVLGHITSVPALRKVAGIMLGRCSDIPANDPPFGQDEEQIARHWCAVSNIPYLGRADIGHDVNNKIVPFGRWNAALA
jgi:muramoyltetrapeptide carboxypeptidase